MADLRRELDIDAGFLSRLLARLQRDGLVARERSTDDARRQRIRLTEDGAAAFAELDRRSADEIGAVLDALSEDDQQRLVARDGHRPTTCSPKLRRPPASSCARPRPGDLGWIVQRHGALYAQQYGWDESFEALVARIVADYAADHDPRREAAWIAEVDGEPAGCVLCVRREDDVAQLRLLLVDPRARGRGIGARLIEECLRFAQRAGLRADQPVDQRRPARGAPPLRARRLRARRVRPPPQLRPRPGRADLGAGALGGSCVAASRRVTASRLEGELRWRRWRRSNVGPAPS